MKTILASMTAVLLLGSTAAWAEPLTPEKSPQHHRAETTREHRHVMRDITPEQFPKLKAGVLRMLDKREAALKKERECTAAAPDAIALMACKPMRKMGPHGPLGLKDRPGHPGMKMPGEKPHQSDMRMPGERPAHEQPAGERAAAPKDAS